MQTRGVTKKAAMACSSGAAKRTRRGTTCCNADAGSREGEEEDTTMMTFSMDRDVLDCRVCFVPFDAQVCKNGHDACAKCCIRANRKCSCCGEPIGDMRNRHFESFLAALMTPCKFARYGCDETVRYIEKRRHGESCTYAPYDCPFDGCGHRGLELFDHVHDEHAPAANPASAVISYARGTTVTLRKDAPFLVLVQPGRERVFVLLNGGDILEGRSLSLVFLGPRRNEEDDDVELQYTMEVTGDGEPGALVQLSASGTVPCARRLEGFQAKGSFLFVPDAYWGAAGQVSVRVRV